MTDPKLEEEIALVEKCLDSLKRFHDIFDGAIVTETVVPEDEGRLQELRALLPSQFQSLCERLRLRPDNAVEQIVDMANSLSSAILLPDFERRKLYDFWHRTYMKLHLLLGRLNHRKEQLESRGRGKTRVGKFFTSPLFFVLAMVLVLLILLLFRALFVQR
jgi:hypothetical protein